MSILEENPKQNRYFIDINKEPPTTIPNEININTLKVNQKIKIMQYNILAQSLIRRDLYPYCDKKLPLKLSYRTKLIMQEIQTLQPDIATLQEVDNFDNIYEKFLKEIGYDYVYIKKQIKEKIYNHGICIIWKKEK